MTEVNAIVTVDALVDALNMRETHDKSINDNKRRTLAKLKKNVNAHVANTFNLANLTVTDLGNFYASKRGDAMRDVYEIEKYFDFADFISQTHSLEVNHYTRAQMLTLINFAKHDLTMTIKDARACCSLDEQSSDASKDQYIVRYAKHIYASTVNSQYRSSIRTLCFFGVAIESTASNGEKIYKLSNSKFAKHAVKRFTQAFNAA